MEMEMTFTVHTRDALISMRNPDLLDYFLVLRDRHDDMARFMEAGDEDLGHDGWEAACARLDEMTEGLRACRSEMLLRMANGTGEDYR